MTYLFRPCTFEMDHQAYMSFLIEHHHELHLPYPFAMKLSFLSSPLMFGKAMLVIEQDTYELAGAAGFVYGTGANDYEDRHICQVEVAFLSEPYRRGALFARLLRSLVDLMKEGEPEVRLVQFWAAARQPEHQRLFSKFLALPGSRSHTMENGLTLYQAPLHELEAWCSRY